MKNKFLDARTAADIDSQVAKILRGLGNPEPPLVLTDVFALLSLDRQYYSTQDDSALREYFSRGIVAGKQISKRPSLILDAVRKWDLKALYLPDRRRVLIDSSQHELKWRWNETHEVIHSVIPWHQTLLHGDNEFCLRPDCHEQLEAEANYGAGRLLTFQDQFIEMTRSSTPSFSLIQKLSKDFGNTLSSTLWRFVEALHVPALGIISQHPHYPDESFQPNAPCRYFIRSQLFESEYSTVDELAAFNIIRENCTRGRRGPVGKKQILIRDDNGDQHEFLFEAFFNAHALLTLITYQNPH